MQFSNLLIILASAVFQLGSAQSVTTKPTTVQGPCHGQTQVIGAQYHSGNRRAVTAAANTPDGFQYSPSLEFAAVSTIVHYTPGSNGKTKVHLYVMNVSGHHVSGQIGFYPSKGASPDYVLTLPAGNFQDAVTCVEVNSAVLKTPITVQAFKTS